MPKTTPVVDVSSFTTDAKFRAWGSAMSAGLASAGFVQTSDTGQINWTTVTKPTATNTQAGYEVWRFNDTLQATKPVFIKIVYGSGASVTSGNSPATWISVGTGSNGSGSITGAQILNIQANTGNTTPSNTAMSGYMNHTNGYGLMCFGAMLTASSPTNPGFWIVERFRNSDGTPNGNGVSLTGILVGTTSNVMYGIDFVTNTAYTTARAITGTVPLSGVASSATGGVVPLGRTYSVTPGYAPLMGALCYYQNDITSWTTFSTDILGASHTYLATPHTNFNQTSNASMQAAILWED